ncbi:MAG: restriction endonuclease subunit S [Candidatus Zixiibacteriota bacterium]
MAGEWRQLEWGEIATLEYGKSLRDYRTEDGRYRVYGTNGPIGWYDKPLCSHPGVIVGRKGAYRGIHYSPEPFYVIDTAFYLEPKQEIDLRWAYYCLLTYDINGMDSGSAIPSTSRESFHRLPVRVPPLIEQQAIACILGAFDDKIELNRRMNRTLEATARAIFRSWFADFGPVHAKAAGQQPPGLKPEIAALFSDAFEDSELGEIPAGWQVRPIGDVVQVLGGGTPSTKESDYWEDGIRPFCTPKDMSSLTDPVLLGTERHLTDEGLAKVSSGQLPVGTVLLSSRAPIGYLAIAETPVSINQGIIAMVCDDELPNLYVLHWTNANMERIIANANGSTFLEISKRNFRPITAVIPKQDILHRFTQIVEPLHQRVVSSLRQILHLADLRDTLLPKLVSGELRVPDAERIVGRNI